MNRMADVGLLLMRVGLGLAFLLHGYPKITGGVEKWTAIGQAIGVFGITFAPAFWGFMASLAEFGGAICLILGGAFRIATAMMAFTMLVATCMLFSMGKAFGEASHALELLFVFLSLMFIGPGRVSLAAALKWRWLQ